MIPVPDPPPLDVQRELAAMRAELAAIRAQERDRWRDEARAQSVRDIVRDALSDSATRASFLSADWTAGLSSVDGTGVFLRANDGTASIQLNGMVQTRFVAASAYGTNTSGATGTNSRWGFETKTVFVTLAGNLVDPSLTYVAAVAYTAQSNRFIDGHRVRLTSKVVVPLGGGNVNGIRNIAGGLGIMAADNNASVIAQLQVMF